MINQPKIGILLLENQITQFIAITKLVESHDYEVFPKIEEYETVLDWARIHLDKRYESNEERQGRAFEYLIEYIKVKGIKLCIIDYLLCSCTLAYTGIELAAAIVGQPDKKFMPIIFLSSSQENTKQIKEGIKVIDNHIWVEKGFAGVSILDKTYIKKYLIDKIPSLLKVEHDISYLEIIKKLKQKEVFESFGLFFKNISEKIEKEGLLDELKSVIDNLNQDELGDIAIKQIIIKTGIPWE